MDGMNARDMVNICVGILVILGTLWNSSELRESVKRFNAFIEEHKLTVSNITRNKEDFDKFVAKLDRILFGNGRPGLIDRLEDMQRRCDRHDEREQILRRDAEEIHRESNRDVEETRRRDRIEFEAQNRRCIDRIVERGERGDQA